MKKVSHFLRHHKSGARRTVSLYCKVAYTHFSQLIVAFVVEKYGKTKGTLVE